jgi:hypothetical protein
MIQIQELDKRVDAGNVNQGEKAWAMEKDTREGQLRKKRKQLRKRRSDGASKSRMLQV